MNVFNFSDYKSFLNAQISENQNVFGYKGKLAVASGCKSAYLSQVLKSHIHFTPDHAAGLTVFWGLSEIEREYFLELVNFARAGTSALQKIIQQRLSSLKEKQNTVSGRVKKPRIENTRLQMKYYSSWHYSAIHILITISKYQNVGEIADRLALTGRIFLYHYQS